MKNSKSSLSKHLTGFLVATTALFVSCTKENKITRLSEGSVQESTNVQNNSNSRLISYTPSQVFKGLMLLDRPVANLMGQRKKLGSIL